MYVFVYVTENQRVMKQKLGEYKLENLKLGENGFAFGVCKGLGEFFNIDRTIFQLLFLSLLLNNLSYIYFIVFGLILINNVVQDYLKYKKNNKKIKEIEFNKKQDGTYPTFKKTSNE